MISFTAEAKVLNKALGIVSKSVATRASLPILQNVKITADTGAVLLTGTNLESAIEIFIGADVETPGEITVPALELRKSVSAMVSGIALIESDDPVDKSETYPIYIAHGNSVRQLFGIKADQFPSIGNIPLTDKVDIADTVTNLLPFTSYEETRYLLSGIYMHNYVPAYKEEPEKDKASLTVVATDGKKMKVIRSKQKPKSKINIIIPNETCHILAVHFTGKIDIGIEYTNPTNGEPSEPWRVCFAKDNMKLTSRLIDGFYPDYELVEATAGGDIEIEFSAKEMIEKIKELIIPNTRKDDVGPGLVMKTEDGKLLIGIKSHETTSTSALSAQYNSDFIGAFNANFMLTIMRSMQDDRVKLSARDNLSPAKILDGDSDIVILPMLIPEHRNPFGGAINFAMVKTESEAESGITDDVAEESSEHSGLSAEEDTGFTDSSGTM